jgi:hypothetical protein
MAPGGNPGLYRASGQPADDRHDRLKEAKMKSQAETRPEGERMQDSAGSQGNGKGIHRQSQGYSNEGNCIHKK